MCSNCAADCLKTRVKCPPGRLGKLLQQVGLEGMLLIVGGRWGAFWYVAGCCVQRNVQQAVQRSAPHHADKAQLCQLQNIARPGKLDLAKIRASPNTHSPHCGHSITPEERTHVDTEHLRERPRFRPGVRKLIDMTVDPATFGMGRLMQAYHERGARCRHRSPCSPTAKTGRNWQRR